MARKNVTLRGILAAVTTPFTEDGSAVDEATVEAQTHRLIDAGIHGLVPCGTSGEFFTLSPEEYRRVIELYVEAADGKVPVIAGVGATATKDAISIAQHAEKVGADALMVVPPFYDPLDLRSLKAFLSDIADAVDLSIMYYNVPGATGIHLSAAEVGELGEIDGVDYLKDTSGDAVALTDLILNHGDRITAFNGWDTLTFLGLATGAQASVWGVAGLVPDKAVEFWNTLAVEGDLVRAREQWRPLWALSDVLESVNYVAGLKAALDMLSHPVGPARAPIQPLLAEDRERLRRALVGTGAIDG